MTSPFKSTLYIAFLGLALSAASITGCNSTPEPDPIVRTTITTEPLKDSLGPRRQDSKKHSSKKSTKPKIQSFSKNEPVDI